MTRAQRRSVIAASADGSALAGRKAIYEELHPDTVSVTARGGPGRGKKNDRQNGDGFTERFTKDAAAKTGMSERTVQRAVTKHPIRLYRPDIRAQGRVSSNAEPFQAAKPGCQNRPFPVQCASIAVPARGALRR
jgi:hypothetical protein